MDGKTIKTDMPAVDKLFRKMAKSRHPNFLEVMAAISDIANHMTDEEVIQACRFRTGSRCQFCD